VSAPVAAPAAAPAAAGPVTVVVPDIGDFDEVAVIELFVKPGDAVKLEQSLITVESDKASMEIPSSHAGTLVELLVKIGDKVSKGTPIAVLQSASVRAEAVEAPTIPSTGSGRTGVDPFGLSPSTELRTGLSKPPSPSNAAPARLFESIEWSTATVLVRTLERAAELGLHVALLPALPDIDEPADLAHLPPTWPEARPA
jgi:pyruvate dehydrogenase E2 component (dihydrolipoamide acetyltransferase)